MGLKKPLMCGAPVSITELIPEEQTVTVWESPGFEGGEGLRVRLIGQFIRVEARMDGMEGAGLCAIDRFLDALCQHTRMSGS